MDLSFEHQTRGLRARAAAAGFAHAHLTFAPSGYSLALLSRAPIAVVYEQGGARFARALLIADSGGARWVAAHLDGRVAYNRAREARWVGALARRAGAARLPVALALQAGAGASPLDARCHDAPGGLREWLAAPGTPPEARLAFARAPGGARGVEREKEALGGPDYRSLTALLQKRGGGNGGGGGGGAHGAPGAPCALGGGGGPFTDAVWPRGLGLGTGAGSNSSRLGVLLSGAGGCDDTGRPRGIPRGQPPVRTGGVFVNAQFAQAWKSARGMGAGAGAGACASAGGALAALSSFAPIECEWLPSG